MVFDQVYDTDILDIQVFNWLIDQQAYLLLVCVWTEVFGPPTDLLDMEANIYSGGNLKLELKGGVCFPSWEKTLRFEMCWFLHGHVLIDIPLGHVCKLGSSRCHIVLHVELVLVFI